MRTHNNVQDFLGRIQIGSVDQLMQFGVRHFIEQKIIYAKQNETNEKNILWPPSPLTIRFKAML